MWEQIVGAGISAIGSLLGGRKNQKAQAEANRENYEAQKEFAQHGIRWKVEDAKAAGLHPLFALGGAGASFAPSAQPVMNNGYAEAGQNLSRAATAFGDKQLQSAQIEALKAGAAKDLALAQAAASEAARFNQQSVISPADIEWFTAKGLPIPGQAQSLPVPSNLPDTPKALPPVPPAYLASSVAEPGFKAFSVPGLGEVILPNSSSMAEALESLENPVLQAAVAAANAAHYGKSGSERLARLMGRSWSDPIGAGVDWARSKLPAGVLRR